MRPWQIKPQRGQSSIEFMLVIILVTLAIIVGGPYILRSVGAHFKLWDVAVQDSMNDNLVEGRPEQINVNLPTCTHCEDTPLECGIKLHNCKPTERLHMAKCTPLGCDFGSETYTCVPDETCCSTPTRTGTCWRSPADTPRLAATVPPALSSQGFKNTCSSTDRVYSFACGGAVGEQLCKPDVQTDDGDRDCTPICNMDQLVDSSGNPIANMCPGSNTGLSDDANFTFATSCDGTKCQATCATGYVLENNACVPPTPLPVGLIYIYCDRNAAATPTINLTLANGTVTSISVPQNYSSQPRTLTSEAKSLTVTSASWPGNQKLMVYTSENRIFVRMDDGFGDYDFNDLQCNITWGPGANYAYSMSSAGMEPKVCGNTMYVGESPLSLATSPYVWSVQSGRCTYSRQVCGRGFCADIPYSP